MSELNQEGDRRPSADSSVPKACPSCGSRYPADALFCSFDGAPLTTSPGAIAAAAATDPYIGREIVGPIEIRQLVGIGAMGRVYRAFQKGIDRDVAVKILHREFSANSGVVARFNREAKVASRLAHPNVVHVLLTGQLPDGAMYIVMEYLDGLSLQSALAASGGAMPLPRALHVALQLCDAVGEAHAQEIVHRDIKPENVMLVKRADDPDFVKVLDFGIARLNWGEQSMATAAGLIFGTARYISPEAAQGEKVGPQGDVYSIATMVYQMLAGRTPFDGDQAVALLVHQIHDPPPPLKSIARAAYVPEPIAGVLMKNLAKRAEERSVDARALGRALLEAAVTSGLSAQDILARPGMAGSPRGVHASAVQLPSMQRTKQLQLEPETAARIGARTSASSTEIADATAAPPVETARISAPSTEPPSASRASYATHLESSPPSGRASAHSSAPSGRMPSSVETTMAGEMAMESTRMRHRERVVMLVVACFLLGAIGMGGLAYRTGWVGGRGPGPSLELEAARANEALLHQHWDSPAGGNVRDITDEGLARWPNDPQLLRIRTLACGDIIKAAQAKRDDGDLGEGLRLARLAYGLDPSDGQAQRLVAELETQMQSPSTESVPPLASIRPQPSAPAAPTSGPRVIMELSSTKPAVGQPIDISARVERQANAPRAKLDGATFRVAGPGLAAGAQLDAATDGSGVYRTSFAFPRTGRFEVTFDARADGAPMRSVHAVIVGDAKPPASPPSSPSSASSPAPATPAPLPPPFSSAKWL